METQNSSPQEKKKIFNMQGRKKTVIIVIIVVFLLFSLAARGFGMRAVFGWGDRGHFNRSLLSRGFVGFGNVTLAAKDFEPMGIVFAEITAGRRDGYGVTYDALMKEAAQKGADAIVNVNITTTRGFFTRNWSGSALAVKYRNTPLNSNSSVF